jgi:citrate lyase subunit beta/citryl-CoA lyase
MTAIAAHAKARDILAIDGPCADFHDRERFAASARMAKALGFDAKWCIHPNQLTWANDSFVPSQREYDHAEYLLERYAHACEEGSGAIAVDGKLVDEATRKAAERIARRGRAAGLTGTAVRS